MYKIIGIDGQGYGPVSAEEIRQWIRENRANAQTRARAESASEWRPLILFPEFADLLQAPSTPPPYISGVMASPSSYPRSQYYYPQRIGNSMAVTGLIFSLVGFVCCCFPIFPVFGLLFSVIGLVKCLRNPLRDGKAISIIAIILCVLELLFWLGMFLWSLADGGTSVHFHQNII